MEVSPKGAPSRTLIGIGLLCGAMGAAYGFLGVQADPVVWLALSIVPFFAAALWIRADARQRHVPLGFDWGLLGYIAWPLLLPWYAWRTRGRRGWRLAFGLVAVMLASFIGSVLGRAIRLLTQGAV